MPSQHLRPRMVIEQIFDIAYGFASAIGSIVCEVGAFWLRAFYDSLVLSVQQKRRWERRLREAKTFEEWNEAALQLDRVEGNDEWKADPRSSDYDYELIQNRLDQLRKAHEMKDFAATSFLLRTSLSRNIGDMGNPNLYAHSYTGTKRLIEEFTNEIVKQLESIGHAPVQGRVDLKSRIDLLKSLRHSVGNTALLLSGGASLGVHHIGVILTLHADGLLPRIISGSSSGAIMAAAACIRTDDEYDLMHGLNGIDLNILVEPSIPGEANTFLHRTVGRIMRLLKQGIIFDQEAMKASMRNNFGDITFLEAYNRTRRVLNITVSSATRYEMPHLLNYLTAPNLVWSAVITSCAVPAFFKAMPLMAKNRDGDIVPWNLADDRWIDGSVENDLPMKRLSELFNVNHFIVCQVNPHVYPFMQQSLRTSLFGRFYRKALFLIGSEASFRLSQLVRACIFPQLCHMLLSVLTQKYEGDITIVPEITVKDITLLFANTTPTSVAETTNRGKRATWPKMSIIRNHCLVELTLDKMLYQLKCQWLDQRYPRPNNASSESVLLKQPTSGTASRASADLDLGMDLDLAAEWTATVTHKLPLKKPSTPEAPKSRAGESDGLMPRAQSADLISPMRKFSE